MRKRSRISHLWASLKLPLLSGFIIGIGLVTNSYGQTGMSPAIWPDRTAPLGDTMTIFGWYLQPSTPYDMVVIRPDGSIVKGDGSQTCPGGAQVCWDTVLTDAEGELLEEPFLYIYLVAPMPGLYQVQLYPSPWSGDASQAPIATTTFYKWADN